MDPGDLTPFGLRVEFLDDGRALLRIGATLIALSPAQVRTLRAELGVGNVQVVNDTPFPLRWALRASATERPGGKNYTLTISDGPSEDPGRIPETLPSNVKRLTTGRKKRGKKP